MVNRRGRLVEEIAALVGPTLSVAKNGDGWPTGASLKFGDGELPLSLHVSTVSPHARRDYEVRFQNPGQDRPVKDEKGFPLLLGIAESDGDPIIVGVDGSQRVGRPARFSILFNKSIIQEAANFGMALYESSSGEKIYAFRPKLLSTFVEAVRGGDVLPQELQTAVQASGFDDEPTDAAAERSRRAVNVLIRHHSFSRRVKATYNNRCCMCGIGVGLVAGAHLYPASAPGSPDTTSNGIALCPNHHAAFDNHDLWIDPKTFAVKFSPRLIADAKANKGTAQFVDSTAKLLATPADQKHRPDPGMLTKRYEHYSGRYDWAL